MNTIQDQRSDTVADHEDMLARALAALEANEAARIAQPGEIDDETLKTAPVAWYVLYKTVA
ncbi:MAG TPA: hypothetical protein VGX49_04450 [Jatrophihabitans sp.]|jgi:hypothetical protein|nr:hypothetical protein [Jatrophihabitans sp.]